MGLPDTDSQTGDANQPYIIVVDKQRKTVVVIDVGIPSDIRRLREELKKMSRLKATVVLVVIGVLVMPPPKSWASE